MSIKVTGSQTEKSKTGGAAPHAARVRGTPASDGAAVERAQAVRGTFAEVAEDVEVRRIIEEIDEVGAELTRFPTTQLMMRYRGLVKAALERVRAGMRINREFKWRRTERSMFITIEKTDELLDELEEALIREGNRAGSLALVDEIKGCLISLLL